MLTNVPAQSELPKEDKEDSEDIKKGKDKKKVKNKEDSLPSKEPEKKVVQLPLEVREYYEIRLKKQILSEKLDGFLKLMKDSRYETDNEFAVQINLQIKAAQQLVADIKQQESEITPKIENKYIIEKLNNDIQEKKSQLNTLSKEYKLQIAKRKMKPEVFKNLREEYKADLLILESNRADLVTALKKWIYELGVKLESKQKKQKILKGRFTSKELKDEEEFKNKHSEFSTKIKNLSLKISTLEKLIK